MEKCHSHTLHHQLKRRGKVCVCHGKPSGVSWLQCGEKFSFSLPFPPAAHASSKGAQSCSGFFWQSKCSFWNVLETWTISKSVMKVFDIKMVPGSYGSQFII